MDIATSLLTTLLSYITLDILSTVLEDCAVNGAFVASIIDVPAAVAGGSADILLLGITTLPVARQLLRYGRYFKADLLVNIGGIGLLTILFVTFVVLTSMENISNISPGLSPTIRSIVAPWGTRLSVAYYTLYLLLVVLVSIRMGLLFAATPSTTLHNRNVRARTTQLTQTFAKWTTDTSGMGIGCHGQSSLRQRFSSYSDVRIYAT